jgi:hypothetical protein
MNEGKLGLKSSMITMYCIQMLWFFSWRCCPNLQRVSSSIFMMCTFLMTIRSPCVTDSIPNSMGCPSASWQTPAGTCPSCPPISSAKILHYRPSSARYGITRILTDWKNTEALSGSAFPILFPKACSLQPTAYSLQPTAYTLHFEMLIQFTILIG